MDLDFQDPYLFGWSDLDGVVAIEPVADTDGPQVRVFQRKGGVVTSSDHAFKPFLIATHDLAESCPGGATKVRLHGSGPLDTRLEFPSWAIFSDVRKWLQAESGEGPGSPSAPYLAITDPVRQYMLQSGVTHFKGMHFEDLHRMQLDIECITTAGFDFCHAERQGDAIVAIGLSDQSGWIEVIGGDGADEATILARFVALVQERDPDVLEGHNLCNFDLPYIATRAARHGIPLRLGRNGSEPKQRSSQISTGDRTSSYTRFDIYGRHVIDTFFLAQAYDQSHRALDSLGLKAVARHFHVAAEDRTYIAGRDITDVYHASPEKLVAYLLDDVKETRAISDILSRSAFIQARMLPLVYQDAAVRGNAVKIDQLMLRAYCKDDRALPKPGGGRPIAGGYTDLFMEGVIRPVHHCDVRSLYPSLMLAQRLGPARDEGGTFLSLLESLRTFRLDAKRRMQAAEGPLRTELDALQGTFKILINSFYGYLGFSQGRFNDFEVADRITSEGRSLLTDMVMQLEALGAQPVEIDTDGIYYVPPADAVAGPGRDTFRVAFCKALPEGIEVEFDDEFEAMYSYKMKNYALLRKDGEIVIKGGALKSRGIERFQRDFLRQLIEKKLAGREDDLPQLKRAFDQLIQERKLPIEDLAKSETLSDAISVYVRKRDQEGGAKRAPYELALQAGKTYRQGDQVSYYVTGTRKNVAIHESSRLTADWNPSDRDENVAYYQAKLDTLYEKFGGVPVTATPAQGELF